MKKLLALLLAMVMVFALVACAQTTPETPTTDKTDGDSDLVAAAKAEGELVVYGSCEEDYL
ncbi:MAG: iron ABC transporter substrate-binding protein, partial [Oscillospiraceae bacterium]|nr:iron ABC transporter substrate-binding protein [Oscillospiraceae bacterium]